MPLFGEKNLLSAYVWLFLALEEVISSTSSRGCVHLLSAVNFRQIIPPDATISTDVFAYK